MIKYLIQDIETIPETELATNWDKEREELELTGKKEPFPPLVYHRVITIGMLTMDEELLPVRAGCAAGGIAGGQTEKEMVTRWAAVVDNRGQKPLRMVDWHGRAFDVPVLQTRAFRYGIPLPWYFGLQPDNRGEISSYSKEYRDRYGGGHDDLCEVWTNRGAFTKPHLADLARLMGLPGKIDGDGSNVYDTWKSYVHAKNIGEGNLLIWGKGTPEEVESWRQKSNELGQKIDTYCMQDVFQTAFVFQRMQYMATKIQLDHYQKVAEDLLGFVEKSDQTLFSRIDKAAVLLKSV